MQKFTNIIYKIFTKNSLNKPNTYIRNNSKLAHSYNIENQQPESRNSNETIHHKIKFSK